MRRLSLLACSVLLVASGAFAQTDVASVLGYPDAVYYNGKIVTVDDPGVNENVGTIVEALAVRGSRILARGTSADMRKLAGPKTVQVDLKGKTVLPGLNMTHEHPMDWMFQEKTAWERSLPTETDRWMVKFLPPGPPAEAIKNVLPAVKELVAKAKPGQWLYIAMDRATNLQWSQGTMKYFPGRGITADTVVSKEILDKIAPNNPVLVKNGWTTGVLNTKGVEALEKVYPGLRDYQPDAGTMTPEEIEQFKKNPTGLLRGILPDILVAGAGNTRELAKLAKASMELWGAYGITAFASSPYSMANFQAYAYLDQRHEMPIRFQWGYQGPDYSPTALSTIAGILGHGSDYMWNVGAWGKVGGACTSLPASAAQKASEDCNFPPGSWGREIIARIIAAGGRVATMHTAGDKDMDYYMDVIEQESKKAGLSLDDIRMRRQTFDHLAGAPRPDQLQRMKRLGMVVSAQNGYLIYQDTSSTAWYARNYGEDSTCLVVPKQSLLKAGIKVGFEVDKPVPWLTFQRVTDAITRYNPSDNKVHCPAERSTRNIELKSMTTWAAYYGLAEDRIGSLEPGKFADFIVLDRDYMTVPEAELPSLHVLMTVVGGKTLHLVPSYAAQIGQSATGPVMWKGISTPFLKDEAAHAMASAK